VASVRLSPMLRLANAREFFVKLSIRYEFASARRWLKRSRRLDTAEPTIGIMRSSALGERDERPPPIELAPDAKPD
jgi:hypothetical protein